ncbi:MAG: FAD-dependent monooxygenase [Hyphomicrobiaceae bacterium]|nr:FAD-dependent monooxygenase [Hyphomicrobiaceae bacterium]
MQQPNASQPFDVVISGASYAGLSLATALAQSLPGIRIALLDQKPLVARSTNATAGNAATERSGDPRSFAISAASRHLLEAIGVWHHIEASSQPISAIEITDSELDAGVRPTILSYANATSDGEAASHIVPGQVLANALAEATFALRDITPIAPAAALRHDGGAALANVRLADGRDVEGRLVVAAEGRRSALRESAGIKLVGWSYEQTGIVVTVAHELAHDGRAVQHFLPSGPFAILPLPGNRSCITWSEATPEARRILALDDVAFLAELDRRFGGRLGRITLDGPRASWPLEMHLARSYVAPRLALIGDTAHGVHPIAGQGLNLAFRDVAALAEVIIDTLRVGGDPGGMDTLKRYERWRRFDATVSTFAFDSLNRLFSNDWTLVRAARDVGLGIVDRLPFVKTMLVAEAAGLTGDLPRLLKGQAL